MSLNRYAYAGANPVNVVDPSGMIGELPPTGCGLYSQNTCASQCQWLLLQPEPFALNRYLGCVRNCQVSGTSGPLFPTNTPLPTETPTPFTFPTNTPIPSGTGGTTQAPPSPSPVPSTPGQTPLPNMPCDPALLPVKEAVLSTFSGTATLDSNNYSWWSGSISGVKITYYGTRALQNQSVTDPAQLSAQEAWEICCGQGSVAIGGRNYRCGLGDTERFQICQNSPPPGFQPSWVTDERCGSHPILSGGTCAVPGKTAAVKAGTGIAGQNIGSMFAFVIPASGDYSKGVPLYLNDGGGGSEFDDRQIDVYAGILGSDSIPTENGGVWLNNIYNTMGNTVCLLARPAVLQGYSPPS